MVGWYWNGVGQSKEECLYLISLAKPHMEKSTVVDNETGKNVEDRYIFVIFFVVLLLTETELVNYWLWTNSGGAYTMTHLKV